MNARAKFAPDVGPRAVQELCRHEMLARLYADIVADMTVCRLEGWDPLEFPRMIRDRMDDIAGGRG